eukprot:COSAG02_NODE_9354_length_2246_cov_3.238472_4_plen_87_part_00
MVTMRCRGAEVRPRGLSRGGGSHISDLSQISDLRCLLHDRRTRPQAAYAPSERRALAPPPRPRSLARGREVVGSRKQLARIAADYV